MIRHLIQRIDIETGVVLEKTYHMNGRRHRDATEGPAYIERDGTGAIQKQAYYWNGRLHREDGPAVIECHYAIIDLANREEFWRHGRIRHWKHGPAKLVRSLKTGVVIHEEYTDDDSRLLTHPYNRDPAAGPAVIFRDAESGVSIREEYRSEGLLHRDLNDGPARLWRDKRTGDVVHEEYYVQGCSVPSPTRPQRSPGGARGRDRAPD